MGALTVSHVSKAYKRYPSKWARAREWLTGTQAHEKHWVLRDINFQIDPGEAVGIVGLNGAGKSTLLKIITGTTRSTTGEVSTKGRVAALLELGMGFHPDFTGRQNALVAGQILGLSIEEIVGRMGEIEAFAEIGAYMDRPVRTYSSGMQMRVAFSVATVMRPDVLIIDEALSVGDAYFQHKSFARIREYRQQGTTLLFVSHDRGAIQSLCDRAILLEGGSVAKEGSPEEVMDFYNALVAERENTTIDLEHLSDGRARTVSGTGEAQVTNVRLEDESGSAVESIDVGQRATLEIEVSIYSSISRLVLGYGIKDRLGQVVYGTNTHFKERSVHDLHPGDVLRYRFKFDANLGEGSYSVQTALTSSETHLVHNYEWRELALLFTVVNVSKPYFAGSAWLDPEIEVMRSRASKEANSSAGRTR